jgi:hypothetical protein
LGSAEVDRGDWWKHHNAAGGISFGEGGQVILGKGLAD